MSIAVAGKIKILLFFENRKLFCKLAALLVSYGYNIVSAITPEELLEKTRKHLPHMLIADSDDSLDFWLSACAKVRDDNRIVYIPIVLLRTNKDDDVGKALLGVGVDGYIDKPFDDKAFIEKVDSVFLKTYRELDTNPLTRLPGNNSIREEVERIIASGDKFASCYVDMDSFKAFNDHYGFARGDDAINLTANTIMNAVSLHGGKKDFVGHIGGDDFVFLTSPSKVPAICNYIIKTFDEKIVALYDDDDLGKSFITHKNRQGIIQDFPIMTLSIGVATNQKRKLEHFGMVSQLGTEMKAYAKKFIGSKYIVDVRADRADGGDSDFTAIHDPVWESLGCRISGGDTESLKQLEVRPAHNIESDLKNRFAACSVVGLFLLKVVSPCGEKSIISKKTWSLVRAAVNKAVLLRFCNKSTDGKIKGSYELKRDGSFLFIFTSPDVTAINARNLEGEAKKLRVAIEKCVSESTFSKDQGTLSLYIGYTVFNNNGESPMNRFILQAIKTAERGAENEERYDRWKKANILRKMIEEKKIKTLFQPVVNLNFLNVVGYEALSRGVSIPELSDPTMLFYLAEEANVVWALESLCHGVAFGSLPRLDKGIDLFLNVDIKSLLNPKFLEAEALKNTTIPNENIIWEISAKTFDSGSDFFLDTVRYLKNFGFKVSIDSVDSIGYGIEYLMELEPDFVKLGMPIVRGVDTNKCNRRVVRTIFEIFDEVGTVVIAKGIETSSEMQAVLDIGINLGQGFYLSSIKDKNYFDKASANVDPDKIDLANNFFPGKPLAT